jgi:hypothetical protein
MGGNLFYKQEKQMKFLTISTIKDIYYTLPKEERDKINAATITHLIERKKEMGGKLQFYSAPGGTVYSITEADSIEEYSLGLMQSPRAAAGYTKLTCIPLMEMDEKAIKAYQERMKAAKK